MKKHPILRFLPAIGAAAVLITAVGCFSAAKIPEAPLEPLKPWPEGTDAALPFRAGINVNGLEGDWSCKYALRTLSDFSTYTNLRGQGFDSIRIPIDFRMLYLPESKSFDEEKIGKIDAILDLAEHAGMYITLDFHGWYDINPRDPDDRETFLTIWRLVAERYADRSDLLAFELMNEPHLYANDLNAFQPDVIAAVRESNPDRLIICAAPDGNQPWQLAELVLPEDDKNLAVAVHIYHPAEFTHQGFTWANPPREKGKQVRLTDAMFAELQWNIDETQKFIDTRGIPVILNEFGLNLDLADPADSDRYLRTLTAFCEKNAIPWAFWEYNSGDMALYERRRWKEAALDALFLR